ncbi:hypothetical protein LEM8419_03262 [Neolewinella maritima]|uniref:Glycosyltransferase RgtA/B/C/D-like domain-containing protein n=1 Tax=Neolewinella maritima TaxID=1383882 RepID=A0ABN8FBF7_9BACT|nr:hypothetical protein [Neolewinella maritima]CAH1002355.1 hypothetical protein LEM8419_03262 [Neolewinella maritima]
MPHRPASGRLHYLVLTVLLCWVTANINLDRYWTSVLEYDIAGYYAYLPAVFIYDDLRFDFFEPVRDRYQSDRDRGDYRVITETGAVVDKYYAGTAVAQLPFFALGHVVTVLTGRPQDGYSYYYIVALVLSSVAYTLLALYFFECMLRWYGVRSRYRWAVIYAMVFGTNIFVYAAVDPGMSHPYSFACLTGLAWWFLRFCDTGRQRYYLLMAAAFGLAVLIRPINLIVLPGLFALLRSRGQVAIVWQQLLELRWKLLWGVLLVVAICSIQLIIYRLQTGQYWFYAYGEEGFDFLRPAIADFLFSYRKGYFLYTPLALLATLSLAYRYRVHRYQATALLLFLALLVYVFSSWWSWWYGGSFSSRVMLEYSAFVFLPLALLLERVGPQLRRVTVGAVIILTLFAQLQIYQFRHGQLHYADTTRAQYWDSFLRVDRFLQK